MRGSVGAAKAWTSIKGRLKAAELPIGFKFETPVSDPALRSAILNRIEELRKANPDVTILVEGL